MLLACPVVCMLGATKPAPRDDPEFQFQMGCRFYSDNTGLRDYREAVHWFRQAARKGHAKAQGMLGLCYYAGRGIPLDFRHAAHWITLSAEQKDPIAEYSLGFLYAHGQGVKQDDSLAAEFYLKAAVQGHAAAQVNFAAALEEGRGVVRNPDDAVRWYRKAAKQDFGPGQLNLGRMYATGRGIKQDIAEAAKWYLQAARNGEPHAQFLIGTYHYFGEGVPQDYVQAYKWLNLAASKGHKMAGQHRSTVSSKMTPQQLSEAQKSTVTHLQARKQTKPKPRESYLPAVVPQPAKGPATGTGFFITQDGFLLTNHHVIANASKVEIHTDDGPLPATIVKFDPDLDLALLKVTGKFTALPIAPDKMATQGQDVFTIGYPNTAVQGVTPKLNRGIINALAGMQDDPRYYQTSVSVQPGNSGGPLADNLGNAIGIVTFRLDDLKTFRLTGSLPQNVNYALKSSRIHQFLQNQPGLGSHLSGHWASPRARAAIIKEVQNATVLIRATR